jgi:hypothetical protein
MGVNPGFLLKGKTQIEEVREISRIFESKRVKLPETGENSVMMSYSPHTLHHILLLLLLA